jgi:hypothetical protein
LPHTNMGQFPKLKERLESRRALQKVLENSGFSTPSS